MTWVLYVAGRAAIEFGGPKAATVCELIRTAVEGTYHHAAVCALTVAI